MAATFFAVDQDEDKGDSTAFALDGVDGFKSGAACGDDVIDDDYVVAGLEVAFDLFARAVALGLLADRKDLQRLVGIFAGGGHANGQ